MNWLFQTKRDGNLVAHATGTSTFATKDGIDEPRLKTVLQRPLLNVDATGKEIATNLTDEIAMLAHIITVRN